MSQEVCEAYCNAYQSPEGLSLEAPLQAFMAGKLRLALTSFSLIVPELGAMCLADGTFFAALALASGALGHTHDAPTLQGLISRRVLDSMPRLRPTSNRPTARFDATPE